jgi:hypothetical protein
LIIVWYGRSTFSTASVQQLLTPLYLSKSFKWKAWSTQIYLETRGMVLDFVVLALFSFSNLIKEKREQNAKEHGDSS